MSFMLAAAILASSIAPTDDILAMQIKLAGMIDNWLEANENAAEWPAEKQKQAEEIVRGASSAHGVCMNVRRDRLKKSREPIEAVVTAILAGCDAEKQRLRRALIVGFRGKMEFSHRLTQADRILAASEKRARDSLTALLVEARL